MGQTLPAHHLPRNGLSASYVTLTFADKQNQWPKAFSERSARSPTASMGHGFQHPHTDQLKRPCFLQLWNKNSVMLRCATVFCFLLQCFLVRHPEPPEDRLLSCNTVCRKNPAIALQWRRVAQPLGPSDTVYRARKKCVLLKGDQWERSKGRNVCSGWDCPQ